MSQETDAPPPLGPAGPEKEPSQETDLLLSRPQDASDSPCEPGNQRKTAEALIHRNQLPDGQGQVSWGTSTNGDLIRTQPQPSVSALERSEGEGGRPLKGHAGLSNGSGVHNGVTPARPEHRKLPSPVSQKMHRKLQSSLSVSSDGSKKSAASSANSQKPGSSPEDCCVHCILACLFCEFLALCNIVVAQASCGTCTSEACCCCCGDDLGDDCNCPCDMDCGIMDACCESSDCLEICMECCGICFPT